MILNFRPLKGALFGSVVPLREALDPLSAEGFTEVAAFYRNEGAVLFSPSFRKICPDIGFDKSLDHFLSTVAAWVVPAEKNLFACFGKSLITGKEDKSGIFLLRAGRFPDCSILGLASFRYSWGNFVVAVPGSEAGPIRQALSALERLRPSAVFDAVDHWGEGFGDRICPDLDLREFSGGIPGQWPFRQKGGCHGSEGAIENIPDLLPLPGPEMAPGSPRWSTRVLRPGRRLRDAS